MLKAVLMDRPGPMEYIPNFIARKHGLEPVTYDIADMEEYLSDTYGKADSKRLYMRRILSRASRP